MKSEIELLDQRIASIGETANDACHNILSALQVMSLDQGNQNAMKQIHRLGVFTRKIEENLVAGNKAVQDDEMANADLEWANALVLMDAVCVDAANICDQHLVKRAVQLQKAGKTA